MVLNIIFGVIALVSLGILIAYRRQVKAMVEELNFLHENETNKMLSRQLSFKEIESLISEINDLSKKYRNLMKDYSVKDRALKETITNISHDIRTPLTSLDGYFQLLQEANSEEERLRYYDIISSRIESLKEILEQLFMFVKLQNDAYEIELATCNTNQILCEVLFSFYEDMKAKEMEPEIEVPEEIYYCIAHEPSLKRVIQNIIKNALDHGKDRLKIILEEKKDIISISIANRRSKEDWIEVERVFDRFYKADAARSDHSTGLGLSIAKQLVDKMDGSIYAGVEDDLFVICVELRKIV